MWRRDWSNKFGASITTVDGKTYRSKVEADYAAHLSLLKQAGEIRNYEHEPCFRLTVNGILIGKIYPDFLVTTKHGQEEIHEVKGSARVGIGSTTQHWHWKWKHLQAQHPEYKYKVITRKDF